MKPRSAALAGALLLAFGFAAAVGYFLGGPYGRDATRRALEVQSLPIGSPDRQIELDLPTLANGPVKNVVLMIGDGMGIGQIQAARLAAFGPDGRFVFERFPVIGLVTTSSASSPVGESAAAATAIATGVATDEGRVGTAPDGRALRTLVEAARDAGFVTGLVTTSSITDATPASFAAHVDSRDDEDDIAAQLADSRVDLLIGGGRERFLPLSARGRRRDRRDLMAEAKARGVTVVESPAELASATSAPLWALVGGRPDKATVEPPIAAWAERALALAAELASRRRSGFFLMIEDEGIDTAGHDNDFGALTRVMVRFDAAVAAAARFAAADGSTLVLVTGDHSTGGLTVDHTTDMKFVRAAWASAYHAGDPVALYAYGPADAAARFGGFGPQREIGRRLAQLLGLDLSANWKGAS